MKGSVVKRCQCRDVAGRRVKGCRKAHGSWAFTIDVGTDPTTGKRRQVSRAGFRTRDEAEGAMTAELATLNAGMWSDDRNVTVGEWLVQWLDEMAGRVGVHTLRSYRQQCEQVLIPVLGQVRLRDLRRGHVEQLIRRLGAPRDDDPRGQGNVGRWVRQRSPRTLDSYRRTLRAALNAAKRRGLVSVNVAEGRIEAMPRMRPRDSQWWEPDETARFLEHVTGDELAPLFEVAAYTGLRRSELLGLRWADLDEDLTGLRVRQVLIDPPGSHPCPACGTAHRNRLLRASAKSDAGARWVPLVRPARQALIQQRERTAERRRFFAGDYADHDLVFPAVDGSPARPQRVTQRFHELTDAVPAPAGGRPLPRIRLHDLRHGAASTLLAGGVPVELVAMILGHASPDVTRQVYAHLMKSTTRDLVEAASDLVTRHRPTPSPKDVSNL